MWLKLRGVRGIKPPWTLPKTPIRISRHYDIGSGEGLQLRGTIFSDENISIPWGWERNFIPITNLPQTSHCEPRKLTPVLKRTAYTLLIQIGLERRHFQRPFQRYRTLYMTIQDDLFLVRNSLIRIIAMDRNSLLMIFCRARTFDCGTVCRKTAPR